MSYAPYCVGSHYRQHCAQAHRRIARFDDSMPVASVGCFRRNSFTKYLTTASSKSSPPSRVSPAVALTYRQNDSVACCARMAQPRPVAAIIRKAQKVHLKNAIGDGQDGDIEGAAAKVKDEHVALFVSGATERLVQFHLVEAVGERSCGGLVDDPQHLSACGADSIRFDRRTNTIREY